MKVRFIILLSVLGFLTPMISAQGIFLGLDQISTITVPTGTAVDGEYRNGNFFPFLCITSDSSVVTTSPNGVVLLGDTNKINGKLITLFSLYSDIAGTVNVEFITTTPDIFVFDSLRVDSVISLNDTVINLADTVVFTNEFGNPDTVFIAADTTILFGDTILVWNHIIDTTIIERKDVYNLEVVFRKAPKFTILDNRRPLWEPPIPKQMWTGYSVYNAGRMGGIYTLSLLDEYGNTQSVVDSLGFGESREIIIPEDLGLQGIVSVEVDYNSLIRNWDPTAVENPAVEIPIAGTPVGIWGKTFFRPTSIFGVEITSWSFLSGREPEEVKRGWNHPFEYILRDSFPSEISDTMAISFLFPWEGGGRDTTIFVPHEFQTLPCNPTYKEPKWRVRPLWKEVVNGHWEIGWDLNLGGNPDSESMTSVLEVINIRYQVVKKLSIPVRGSVSVSELLPNSSLPEVYVIRIRGQSVRIQMGRLPH